MKDLSKLSPKQWAQVQRERLGMDLTFEWNDQVMSTLLASMPQGQRPEAEKVWRSRVGSPISDIHEEQIMQYLSSLVIPKKLLDDISISAEQFILMPTNEINAYAGTTPRGDRIVVIHQALTHVVAIFSHWLLFAQEEASMRKSVPHEINKEMERYFLAIWFSDSSFQNRPQAWPKTEEFWELSEFLSFSVMRFILAHEIGHIFHNHKGYTASQDDNHRMEYEADDFAFQCCIWTSVVGGITLDDNYFSLYSLLGPFFGLAIISLLGDEDTNTHPSCQKRLARLLSNFDERFEESTSKVGTAKFIEWLGADFKEVIQSLTAQSMAVFAHLRPGISKEISKRSSSNTWLTDGLFQWRQS